VGGRGSKSPWEEFQKAKDQATADEQDAEDDGEDEPERATIVFIGELVVAAVGATLGIFQDVLSATGATDGFGIVIRRHEWFPGTKG